MGMREKLIELLCKAHGMATDASLFEDASYAQQLETEADHLIANGVTIQKWIPVTEQPKERGFYFVTVKHWLDGKPVTIEAYWNSVDWMSCERRHELTPRVTHWMPLPSTEGLE